MGFSMRTFRPALFAALLIGSVSSASAQQRCEIPREARDIWRCENGFVIGPENIIVRLQIGESDPEALYNAGLEAAQREDWRIAVAYFTAAHQRTHLVPRYMYNLGLAHARAGNEVAALAWLAAYLVAEPEASNRAAIWQQIAALEATVDHKIEVIWRSASQAVETLPLIPFSSISPESERSSAYVSMAYAAGAASDWERARTFLQRANEVEGRTTVPMSDESLTRRLQSARVDARSAALLIYDRETAEALNNELQTEPREAPDAQRWLYRAAVRPRLGWEWPSDYARGDVLNSVDVPNRPSMRGYTSLTAPSHLAARGQADAALTAVRSQPAQGWFGEAGRGLEAARVGEILLLGGDVAGANRALSMARRSIDVSSPYRSDVDRLSALLMAERGDLEDAVSVLTIVASRLNSKAVYGSGPDGDRCCIELGGTRSPQHQWSEFRFYATAQVVRFLFWRGKTHEAIALNERMDSLRGYSLLLYGASAEQDPNRREIIYQAQRALHLRASGGRELSPERRAIMEDAIITARRLPGAAYDLEGWIEAAPLAEGARQQFRNLYVPAQSLALGLRMVRISYGRSGREWGH